MYTRVWCLSLVAVCFSGSLPADEIAPRRYDSELTPAEIRILRDREQKTLPKTETIRDERIFLARQILDRGEVTPSQYIAGGVVGTVVGFGTGHIFQKRYLSKGWIFTVIEGALVGISAAANDFRPGIFGGGGQIGLQGAALGTLLGIRVWQAIDLWTEPPHHNERYRHLRNQLAQPLRTSFRLFPGGPTAPLGLTAVVGF